jgi:hypothetical protein
VNVKREPLPGSLSTRIAPAVQLDELARDREAEARCPRSCATGADLAELLEHRLLVLGRDAHAGVAHRDLDAAVVRRRRTSTRPPSGVNLIALVRRLSRICLSLRSSARKRPRRGSIDATSAISRPLRALAHERHRVRDRVGQREVGRLELHAAGLDLREVEDVVDEREQVAGPTPGCPAGTRPASR